MIYFKEITQAIENQLKNFNTDDKAYIITRNRRVNTDPNASAYGWIGIYRDRIGFEMYSSGNTPWLTDPEVKILAQASSILNEEDCEDKLDNLVNFIMLALESDRTLGGYVHMIKEYEIDYSDDYLTGDQMQIYHQSAEITVTCEVKA